ncbi:hypothetical protein NBO_64g0047 [Nosema bombycis CQ1]|uniref:Uncharacterized protein n=1 Tax=Nosema bombycis (strain CQ1 / CVCC 102059) TaxID=578461 RepID=R0KSB6_NOSB1|nr:hypothetical protein NBO_64g0047 [Nosema bombycis CQ1]|eukprot:EOB13666.1 hypothetical protein NBO_64g0047 [Nosema bombycis CQ1]
MKKIYKPKHFKDHVKNKKSTNEIDPIEIKIRKAFLTPSKLSIKDKLSLLNEFLDCKPKYLNEIRDFLKENDLDLYKKYADCFKTNLGVKLAFGIELEEGTESNFEIKRVESLKPVYQTTKDKKSDLKKKLIRKNKKEIREKFVNKQEKKKEYEEKMVKIKEKIKKN